MISPTQLYAEQSFSIATLRIDNKTRKVITPIEYGLHYEEIGMMGDGALHAELIRNRSFEEANPPKGLTIKDGLYQNIPAPNTEMKEVFGVDPLIGWTTTPLSYSPIFISRTDSSPMSETNRHSMRVNVSADITNNPHSTILNRGYYGMNFKVGVEYNLSLYLMNVNYKGEVMLFLTDENGKAISNIERIRVGGKEWHQSAVTLCPTTPSKRGMLAIRPLCEGEFLVDVVTMLPSDTWDGGRSIFRADIMENLKEFSPSFIRFPGGCIVHGVNEPTMYNWKSTIGQTEQRAGQWSKWAPYYRTDGIGYHEFYELCEYLGADAMYVISTGMVCTGWVWKSDDDRLYDQPEVDLDHYINDALDAIEYAIGDTTTKWGAKRAANGHLEPFPLKYIEIGNEDFGSVYWDRYEKIYNALSSKYPQLIYIANSIIGRENPDKRKDIPNFINPQNVKVFDEHHYQSVEWACENHYKFDNYERDVADLFVGELGIGGSYPTNLLATASIRMAMERNGDLNPMLAERPVMRQWDFMEHRNTSTMLLNGVDSSVKGAMFYICQMFNTNRFDTYIESRIEEFEGRQDIFATLGYDSSSKEYILKIINLRAKDVVLDLKTQGFGKKAKARVTTLELSSRLHNTPLTPDAVVPHTEQRTIRLDAPLSIVSQSFTIYRFK
ncbi:MAG: alpha-L-arabinofuranosidase C-terminal domain-containing protein [Rikenellaceae bacterium]